MSDVSAAIESASLGVKPDPQDPDSKNPNEPKLKISTDPTTVLGRFNERASEWFSSILVKETRQVLKSRQFIWTYLALLIGVGVWTTIGLSTSDDQYATGQDLLGGFWFILGFPLLLIIPFSAYRSLAREFEDGTISLISITTMKPSQIVMGKFGSAILQMLMYLSVLAPCICFTYTLRGISLEQIGLGLLICVGGSLCLTVLGLFAAGVFRSRALGVGVSVLFVLLLGWLYFLWCQVIYNITYYGSGNIDEEGWIVFYACVALFASTAALLLVTAVAQISFPSDNRSTPIRVAMFVQQILFFAFLVMVIPISPTDKHLGYVMSLILGHYWLLMGFLMIGESVFLSRRVQRTLPRTLFSRSVFSLFMPGAGRGFLFAVANIWACAVVVLLIIHFQDLLLDEAWRERLSSRWGTPWNLGVSIDMLCQGFISCLFVTWFLSIIYLVMRWFRRQQSTWSTGVGPTVSLVLGALLVAVLSIGSFIIHMNSVGWRYAGESSLALVPNWYLFTYEVAESGIGAHGELTAGYLVFAIQKLIVIGFAFSLASRELLVRPIPVPERVKIETENPKSNDLPEGESIDEIFGELKK